MKPQETTVARPPPPLPALGALGLRSDAASSPPSPVYAKIVTALSTPPASAVRATCIGLAHAAKPLRGGTRTRTTVSAHFRPARLPGRAAPATVAAIGRERAALRERGDGAVPSIATLGMQPCRFSRSA